MKTKIIHYGNDSEIFDSGMGTYDEHDSETKQGVYGKAEMVRFAHIVTDHFLTPRQKYFYFQCVVYGKKVENVAEQEGLDDSTVYKHLKLAKQKIASVKELMRIAGGKKGIIVLFQQTVQTMTSDCQTVAYAYYVDGRTIYDIIQKTGKSYRQIYQMLSDIKNRCRWNDITADDLAVVRCYFQQQKNKGA